MTAMGRPKTQNPKAKQLTVRLDEEIFEKLEKSAEYYNTTRVDIIRQGIEKVFDTIKK